MICSTIRIILYASSVSAIASKGTGYSTIFEDESVFRLEPDRYWPNSRLPPMNLSAYRTGTSHWASAYSKAKLMVDQMTNEEKNNITYGVSNSTIGCSGDSQGVTRLGFPGLCLQDGPSGVRGSDMVSAFPSGIHLGASWNETLLYKVGQYKGAEFRAKGVNVALGPVVGPLGRVALGGRNWEGYAADPYLAGKLAAQEIQGMQLSVMACIKHLIANEQEKHRMPVLLTESVSSNLDDRTLHELYLWPFQDAVRAGVASVMCSYNKVNNSYACQNSKVLNGLLKTELGFQGFVVSDWGAQHAGVASADAGLDLAMPSSPGLWDSNNLAKAVANGSLAQGKLDDMATRIIAAWYYLNQDSPSYPWKGIGMTTSILEQHKKVYAVDPASKDTIRQAAIEGHVLVKNLNNALPLKSPKMLNLFGYDATVAPVEMPTDLVLDGYPVNKWIYGYSSVDLVELTIAEILGGLSTSPDTATLGTLIAGGGSGATTPGSVSAPFDAFQQQAYEDSTYLLWDFSSHDPFVDPEADACIVFINQFSSEGSDRGSLTDPDSHSDTLVLNVAKKCKNTIVVIHNAGIRIVDAWIEHVNITAVIYGHLPGQDSGRALVDVMYGKQSPSGRLTYTVAKRDVDYGHLLSPSTSGVLDFHPQSNFSEGLYIDYRYFQAHNITPRFEFGYGLTYTDFSYASLSISHLPDASISYLPPDADHESPIPVGGLASLFEPIATVNCTITNVGSVTAAEVAQLYVGIPSSPARQLRGFRKLLIEPGKSASANFELTRRDLSIWDVISQQWVLQQDSTYQIYVGASVLDIRLRGELRLK